MAEETPEQAMTRLNRERGARRRAIEEPHYSPTLAMAIAQRLGPGFASAYSPSRKHFVETPGRTATHGFYVHPDAEPETVFYPFERRDDGTAIQDYFTRQPDHVYGVDPEPNAQVFAHEFRHRGGVQSEYDNRLYDAMYSPTEADWLEAVRMYHNYVTTVGDFDSNKLTLDDAEAMLIERIQPGGSEFTKRKMLLGKEWDRAPEWDKPVPMAEEPSLGGFLSSLLADDRRAYQFGRLPYEDIVEQRRKRKQEKKP